MASDDSVVDAYSALARFQRSVWIVCRDAQLRRRVLLASTRAFKHRGEPQHQAWSELVSTLREALREQPELLPVCDAPERASLHAFVDENADTLETRHTVEAS